MGGIRYELLAEEAVPDTSLALANELLTEAYGADQVRNKAWVGRRPIYRVLAWDGDILVGNEAGCLVDCQPPIVLHGIADAAVRVGWRSQGIARELGTRIHQEAIRRGAAAVICDTGALGRVALEHGMRAVQPGELYLRRRFRRPLPLVESWYVRWHGKEIVPLTIHGLV